MVKDNVVPFKDHHPHAVVMQIDQLDSYHGRKKIAQMLRNWNLKGPKKERTYSKFASKVGLSVTTVSRFASEETKAPRLHTILMIMKGLGFSVIRFDF